MCYYCREEEKNEKIMFECKEKMSYIQANMLLIISIHFFARFLQFASPYTTYIFAVIFNVESNLLNYIKLVNVETG